MVVIVAVFTGITAVTVVTAIVAATAVTAIVATASVVLTFLVLSTAAAIVIQPINIVVDTATAAMVTGAVSIGVAFIAVATDTVAGIVDLVAIEALTSPIFAVDAVDNLPAIPPNIRRKKRVGYTRPTLNGGEALQHRIRLCIHRSGPV